MFATLVGGYPAPDTGDPASMLERPPAAEIDARVRRVIEDQLEVGLGLLTDGSVRWPDPVAAVAEALLPGGGVRPERASSLSVDGWAFAQGVAGEAAIVKQCLPGPYTLGRRRGRGLAVADRADLTLAFADALAGELVDLAAAGCVFIQVDEPAAIEVGSDPAERRLFLAAHDRLAAGLAPVPDRPHLSLAVVGGNADAAGPETIFAPAYDSFLLDLIAGPDNWRLAMGLPIDRGLVLGVVDASTATLDDPEVVVFAIGYAASSGRGEERIGIAPSGSLAGLPQPAARAKLELLVDVVGLVEQRAEEAIAASLDPRAVDARSAALGAWRSRREPGPPRG